MYEVVLVLHSITRWLVVLAGLGAFALALRGWLAGRDWSALADRLGLIFTIVLDVQLLIGIILYVVSPLVQSAFADFGAAMGASGLRFFALEHVLLMVVAVVIAHVGRARVRRADTPHAKYRQAALLFGLAIVVILLAVPWPFLPYGRPWLRL
ncbi:MAG: hypothetical protein Kow0077_02370 [Anaerolineae bacterium]